MTGALSCVRVHNSVDPHGGCCYVESVTAHIPEADTEWLRRTPMPPCRDGADGGLFILVPLSNGAAVKAPICREHAELIASLHPEPPGDGAAG